MDWLIAAIIAPVPLFHLWLHALLPQWQRFPWMVYAWGLFLWILSLALFAKLESGLFFIPQKDIKWLGWSLIIFGTISIVSSIITLGMKRFFMWAVLKPDSVTQKHITKGILHFVPHPAYFGYLAISLGNFLSIGEWHLLFLFLYLLIFTPIVIRLEEEELHRRTGT